MKKIYLFLLVIFITSRFAIAQSCVIDSSNTNFLAPHPDSIPCIERGITYSQTVQLLVPDSIDLINYGSPFSFVLYIDSVILNGIDGLPVGISNAVNPAPGVFYPGQYACVLMSGTSTDLAGNYYLTPNGTITAHGTPYPPIFDGDTTIDLALLQAMSLGQLDLFVDVIEQGAACRSLWPGAVCIIDSTNTQFFSPSPDSIPCIERGVGYNQIIQIHIPENFDIGPFAGLPPGFLLLNVDSMQIDSITDFPNGLVYELNPSNGFFLGGDNGCAFASGITNDPTGNYPLSIHGTISVSGIPGGFGFPPDTTFDLGQAQSMSGMFNLSVDVINTGEVCRPVSGISTYHASLNIMMDVYPNPSNGNVVLKLNAGGRVDGEIAVIDMSGRKVFAQTLDVQGTYTTTIDLSKYPKGIYAVQLKTTEGFASKTVAIE
ncbi:MAG: T9SS type A sorting domain-containing protein [Bacteroidota bacterium]